MKTIDDLQNAVNSLQNISEDTEIPRWSTDLKTWREEKGLVGGLWDVYSTAAEKRIRIARTYFLGLGFILGYAAAYAVAYIQK